MKREIIAVLNEALVFDYFVRPIMPNKNQISASPPRNVYAACGLDVQIQVRIANGVGFNPNNTS